MHRVVHRLLAADAIDEQEGNRGKHRDGYDQQNNFWRHIDSSFCSEYLGKRKCGNDQHLRRDIGAHHNDVSVVNRVMERIDG
ncbi:hypothetical protein SDC9_184804 [bioreactor metagenome]|uniref:Uncharacterized protein n=1 Tax=bioreactor metagenome TaxID=1076179 RepID=A0A645HE26_9ZZZZ